MRATIPPVSISPSRVPAQIQSKLLAETPPIILVEFRGRVGLDDIERSRDFGNVVKSLGGKRFRVLCDFTQAPTMAADVCAVFVKGQEFAVARGMERDAFVCSSSVLRLQFVRIARESGRSASLGPVQFFDSLAEGRAYLEK
jgi:hypothetical protein